jgi:hypothetical protein
MAACRDAGSQAIGLRGTQGLVGTPRGRCGIRAIVKAAGVDPVRHRAGYDRDRLRCDAETVARFGVAFNR